jgi:hypothetical protein
VRPDTSYVLDGDVHIAYQVLGTGSRDLLLVPEFWHSIEAQWGCLSSQRFSSVSLDSAG